MAVSKSLKAALKERFLTKRDVRLGRGKRKTLARHRPSRNSRMSETWSGCGRESGKVSQGKISGMPACSSTRRCLSEQATGVVHQTLLRRCDNALETPWLVDWSWNKEPLAWAKDRKYSPPGPNRYAKSDREIGRVTMTAVASAENRKITWRQVAETKDPEIVRSAIASTKRRWGTFFLAAGIFQLIGATGMALRDPVWGAVLILAGAAAFVFRSAAMLAAYGVLIAWAMFSNLLSGNWYGMVGAAVQAFLAFGAFRGFSCCAGRPDAWTWVSALTCRRIRTGRQGSFPLRAARLPLPPSSE